VTLEGGTSRGMSRMTQPPNFGFLLKIGAYLPTNNRSGTAFRFPWSDQPHSKEEVGTNLNWKIDWHTAFVPSVSPLEIILRGTVMYLALFVLLRVVLKRQSGTFSTADLLLVVLLADASQNGMAAEYKSATDGIILVVTLVFWNYTLDWLGYRFPLFDKLVFPPPLALVQNGKLLRRNMRQELISEAELMAHLREEGIEKLEDVKAACMEGDGQISVIRKEPTDDTKAPKKRGV